jgi:hypothetical protein
MHQELAHRHARDSKGRFSSRYTRTPPSGSPSSGSKSNDDSMLDMWYVALTPTHQQETIVIEGVIIVVVRGTEPHQKGVFLVCHDRYFYVYLCPRIRKKNLTSKSSTTKPWQKGHWVDEEGAEREGGMGREGGGLKEGDFLLEEGGHQGHDVSILRWGQRCSKDVWTLRK